MPRLDVQLSLEQRRGLQLLVPAGCASVHLLWCGARAMVKAILVIQRVHRISTASKVVQHRLPADSVMCGDEVGEAEA